MQEDLKNSASLMNLPTFPLLYRERVGLRTREELIWLLAHGSLTNGLQASYGMETIVYEAQQQQYARYHHDRLWGAHCEARGATPWTVVGRPIWLLRWLWQPRWTASRQLLIDDQTIPFSILYDGIDVGSLESGQWLLARGMVVDQTLNEQWRLRHLIRKNGGWLELVEQKRDAAQLWEKEQSPVEETILATESSLQAIQKHISARQFLPLEHWRWISRIFLPTMMRELYFEHMEQVRLLKLDSPLQERAPDELVERAQWRCFVLFGGRRADFLPDITRQLTVCQEIENDWQELSY